MAYKEESKWKQFKQSTMRSETDVHGSSPSHIESTITFGYKVDLLSPLLQSTFSPSQHDADTEQFLSHSSTVSECVVLQLYYAFVSFILSFFVSKTTINGILHRGEMFLFSPNQLKDFLQISPNWNPADKQVLDLGAGDGGITKSLAVYYKHVYVTEMSQVMRWRLHGKGFHVEDVEGWNLSFRHYNLITALNLLDRHYNPRKLLGDLHELALRSDCLVLLAVVLPMHQYVEFHPSRKSTNADVILDVQGCTFEEQASSLVENEFLPMGYEVVRWTKLPYLCEGDLHKPFYVLEDAVFLLRPKATNTRTSFRTNISTFTHDEL